MKNKKCKIRKIYIRIKKIQNYPECHRPISRKNKKMKIIKNIHIEDIRIHITRVSYNFVCV